MTRLLLPLFVVALLAGVAAVSVPAEPQPPGGDAVAALVAFLGSREYAERERAMKALIARGESVLPVVREAANRSLNPEIRWRANRVWTRILLAAVSKSTGMKFAVILPGEFTMGAAPREPGRQFDERERGIRLTPRFLIGKHEVTQAEYEAVTELTPSHFAATGDGNGNVAGLKTDNFPVDNVTWFDAVAFCNALGKKDGLKEFYTLADVKRENGSITSASVTRTGGNGYRLPTEAEWEYACRAGTDTAFHFGPRSRGGEGNFKTVIFGGYGGNTTRPSKGRTTAVGEYKPNRWGLLDTHGNAGEWCDDWYAADYDINVEVNPTGPKKGRHKVARGGSWFVTDTSCRSASRHPLTPDEKKNYVGFRVARTP